MPSATTPIQIDGSYGEGGGQIIRTSLSLSAITGQPFEITNIRAGRSKPGLQPQHLAAVRAAQIICCAHLEGDSIGSTRLAFSPGTPVQPGTYRFEIGTAGAATLVAQTVLCPLGLANGDSEVTIVGGTHVPHAPPADYLLGSYIPAIRATGLEACGDYSRAGFFPKGGGEIRLAIRARARPGAVAMTERGALRSLTAFIVTSELPDHVFDRGASTVDGYMKGIGRRVDIERREKPSLGPGAAVVLSAECENGLAGFSSLGERGKPMEKVAEQACRDFLAWWKTGAAVDEHLSDQLVLPAVLTPGEHRWTTPMVTEHLRTAVWVAGKFVPLEYDFEEQAPDVHLVRLRS